MRGRLPSPNAKPRTAALPWDHSRGRGPGSASGKGLLLWLVSDVSAGGWLPDKVSNTQFLPKQNRNQHKQLKLPESVLPRVQQVYLHWILSTFGLHMSKHSAICLNGGWSRSLINQKRRECHLCRRAKPLLESNATLKRSTFPGARDGRKSSNTTCVGEVNKSSYRYQPTEPRSGPSQSILHTICSDSGESESKKLSPKALQPWAGLTILLTGWQQHSYLPLAQQTNQANLLAPVWCWGKHHHIRRNRFSEVLRPCQVDAMMDQDWRWIH